MVGGKVRWGFSDWGTIECGLIKGSRFSHLVVRLGCSLSTAIWCLTLQHHSLTFL